MKDVVRMLRAILGRRYRVTPWLSLGALMFVLVYAIDPIDIIPDYLPIIGFVDDAAMLGLLYKALRRDVGKFRAWENEERSRATSSKQLPVKS